MYGVNNGFSNNFGVNLPKKRYIPLTVFIQNLALGMVSQVRTLTPNFTVLA